MTKNNNPIGIDDDEFKVGFEAFQNNVYKYAEYLHDEKSVIHNLAEKMALIMQQYDNGADTPIACASIEHEFTHMECVSLLSLLINSIKSGQTLKSIG